MAAPNARDHKASAAEWFANFEMLVDRHFEVVNLPTNSSPPAELRMATTNSTPPTDPSSGRPITSDYESKLAKLAEDANRRLTNNPLLRQTLQHPHPASCLFFASTHEESRKIGEAESLLGRCTRQKLDLVKDTLLQSREQSKAQTSRLDKERRAVANAYIWRWGRLTDDHVARIIGVDDQADSKQPELVRKYVSECQRLTCELFFAAMSKLFHLVGPEKWDQSTLQHRQKLYSDIYDQMPLVIDLATCPMEQQTIDFVAIHKVKHDLAEACRRFNRHRFLRLAEATMYFRVWKFKDWKEPVYEIWETVALDQTVERDLGVPIDVGELPGKVLGARGVNYRPIPVTSTKRTFSALEDF